MKAWLTGAFFACLVFSIAGFAASDDHATLDISESNHFVMKYPRGWEIIRESNGTHIQGPNRETIYIAVIPITGFKLASGGSEADWRRHRTEFGEYLISKMHEYSKDARLEIVSPLAEFESRSGFPVWQIQTESTDGSSFYNLYGAVGLRAVLLIDLQGGIDNVSSADAIFQAIKNIEWK